MSTSGEQPDPITPMAAARIRELQSLITESQRKADKTDDEDLREAWHLEASKLGLMVARLKRGQPEVLPVAVEKPAEEELEPLPKPTPEQEHEADMLIQRAMLENRRGNKQAASDLFKKAAEVAPGAASVLEILGDDFMERRQYVAAQEAYQAAHRADPTRPGIERKLGELAMKGLANMSVEDQLRMGSFDSPFIQQGESLANPKAAAILSAFFPGLGQLVMGQTKKGLTILSIVVLASIIFALLATKLHSTGEKSLPAIAYFPLLVAIATWLVGVADASMQSKSSGPRTPPSKPAPPVNLPFE
jgi:tetratricopeptide (TPR) repeat protein